MSDSFSIKGAEAAAKKILFIGAGASFGARLRHSERPPLGNELCRWLRIQIPKILSLNGLLFLRSAIRAAETSLGKHAEEENFEILVSKLDRADRIALQNLLRICFSDLSQFPSKSCSNVDLGFKSTSDGYDNLVKKIAISPKDWIVVSLNYDLLFEQALDRAGIDFFYPHFPFSWNENQKSSSGLRIYKPHGSINFYAHADPQIFRAPPSQGGRPSLPTQFELDDAGKVTPEYPIVLAAQKGVENVITMAAAGETSSPVMANYTTGKRSDANHRTLALVRNEALELARGVESIWTVGVRPIEIVADDDFVFKMFAIPYPRIIYVSGSSADCGCVRNRYPDAQTYPDGLDEYLSSI